jgi:hypothetical protein
LLEELEIKFVSAFKYGGEGPPRRLAQGRSEYYKCLKSMRAREFTGQRDQLELMIHIVENAPALEILTIDATRQQVPADMDIRHRATASISEKLSAKTKFIVV